MELQPIQSKIYEIRGQRVMLDFDLAELYQVETRVLKQAVRRNIERFPEDFMLRLSAKEANRLIDIGRSQNVIPQGYNIGSSEMFAFTEEGVAMLSGVLRSKAAVQVNIAIMRAFVAMRNYITTTTTVTAELSEIRARLALLEQTGKDNAEAVSDLSEDMRRELDSIYQAIGALSVKLPQALPAGRIQTGTPGGKEITAHRNSRPPRGGCLHSRPPDRWALCRVSGPIVEANSIGLNTHKNKDLPRPFG